LSLLAPPSRECVRVTTRSDNAGTPRELVRPGLEGNESSIDQHLVLSTVATLKRVFTSVLVLTRQDMNRIIFAFPQERSVGSIESAFQQAVGSASVRQLALRAATATRDMVPPPGTVVFTDDRAPIEEMTRRMVADAHSSAAQSGSPTRPR
jgi:hypothetical protein